MQSDTMLLMLAETAAARHKALKYFQQVISTAAGDEPELQRDLDHAATLIARGVGKASWTGNQRWFQKYVTYIHQQCPKLLRRRGLRDAVLCPQVALAFLAAVNKENPKAKTRVDAAKRAINLARTMARLPSLKDSADIALMAKAARNPAVATPRQSPGLPLIYIRAIIKKWGTSPDWWKRQVATMLALAFCIIARGAGIVSCETKGIAWVRHDGALHGDPALIPDIASCAGACCVAKSCARGVLLLVPWRKNKQNVPSWLPISDHGALVLLARHMRWRLSVARANLCMFPALRPARRAGQRTYRPATGTDDAMDVDSLREWIRKACMECCGIDLRLAKEFGTHSIKIGSVEYLRSKGVPEELRRQLGGWMSKKVALHYLQLSPASKLNILDGI